MATGTATSPGFSPLVMMEAYSGLPVPDPVTFALSEQWLNKPRLYPRQVTLLKIIFLRDDLFTDYDRKVIDEWRQMFADTNPPDPEGKRLEIQFSAQTKGIQPDVYERIKWCREHGRRWFAELILAVGRRGSKGFISAIAMAYVLWHYLAKGNPQEFYGIDQSKAMEIMIFAGKKDQAKRNLWADLHAVITESGCFTGSMGRNFINANLVELLSVWAPYDEIRLRKQAAKGIVAAKDMATFQILPKESNPLAARGGAGFIVGFDEAAHVKTTGITREFGEVYNAARPALDQFGTDGFVCLPSSTWEMTGRFFELWVQSLQNDPVKPGEPMFPNKLMLQLSSWHPYEDWEIAQDIPLFPEGFKGDNGEYENEPHPRLRQLRGPIQAYDEELRKEEQANPDTFAVERRCLDPATRVLTTDLTWKPIGEIEVGDTLIGLDEHGPGPELLKSGANGDLSLLGKRPQRKLRTTTVLKTWRTHDKAYRITFTDGSTVTCSGAHRWFSGNRWRSIYPPPGQNGPREMLRVGDSIRWLVDPWEEDESREAGYLAGMYDGEGSFLGRGRDRQEFSLTVSQNPGSVLDETLRLLKDKGFSPVKYSQDRLNQQWYLTNLDECLRFLGQIRPVRFWPKRAQLWEGRAPHGSHDRSKTKTIVSIEKLPEQELVDIETTTHTFIAEGLVSHNSDWATSLNAYLNPARVDDIFVPWTGRLPRFGPPQLTEQERGLLSLSYFSHGDPASVNHRFGFALGHAEPDEQGMLHAVFDLIKFWDPADFTDHIIDYDVVNEWIFTHVIMPFQPTLLSFDQYNVMATVPVLVKRTHAAHLQKQVIISKAEATGPLNWARWECMKAAVNLHMAHCYDFPELKQELKFLTKPEGVNKVEPPESGPCTTNDIADAFCHVIFDLLGEQMSALLPRELGDLRPGAAMGYQSLDPFKRFDPNEASFNPFASQLSQVGHGALARGQRPSTGGMPSTFTAPTRGSMARRGRHRS
jgi:hypothetical protein